MNPANDRFEQYFTEKIWEIIPPYYREEDGLALNPGVLRAIVELLAARAADVRRAGDALWDDEFIDLCRNWVVPYLADLVDTRLIAALNPRGRRVDVAKTIYYRRRKGTLRVLEELIADITEWEGVVREEFRRLARPWHGLDPNPLPLAGRITGTMPGSFADLRRARGAELAQGPFDEYAHWADVRKPRGRDGLYNIPKIGFHLYRLQSVRLAGVQPAQGPSPSAFLFDPSARDIPLFQRRNRETAFDWDQWRTLREWEVPGPIRCRVLGNAEFIVTEALVLDLVTNFALPAAAASDLRKLVGIRLVSEERLVIALGALPSSGTLLAAAVFQEILRIAMIPDCGKSGLLPSSALGGAGIVKSIAVHPIPAAQTPADRVASANLSAWTATAPAHDDLVIDPERGRMLFTGGVIPRDLHADYQYGFSADIGAGGYQRFPYLDLASVPVALLSGGGAIAAADIAQNGVTTVSDSSTYTPVASRSGIRSLVFQASDSQRPYLRPSTNWILNTGANTESVLTLEGLWIGPKAAGSLILRGDWETVTIRHSTLDPGGKTWNALPIEAMPIVIEGDVGTLLVQRSIIAAVSIAPGGSLEKLVVRDSIIQSITAGLNAIDAPLAGVDLIRTTVFGGVKSDRLYASEALITDLVDIDNTQEGCFRFSAAPVKSRVPHPYESHFFEDKNFFFTSRDFGQPGYAQLAAGAPLWALIGAENGSEIGAFSNLMNPIRMDGLRAKVDEYLPFGLIPALIFET
jgi:hypothetical protein